ncbi:MAG: DUF1697 domain-containing protein [Beutenbergiaceae bacterium]
MATHLALLRGINVGKHARVPMSVLREVVAGQGFTGVGTYLQSGNIVFTAPQSSPRAEIAQLLRTAIAAETTLDPAVIVLSKADWGQVVAQSPVADLPDPRLMHAFVRQDPVEPELGRQLSQWRHASQASGSRDDVVVRGQVAYLSTPDGFAGSKLAERLSRLDAFTARNWRSVVAIDQLL